MCRAKRAADSLGAGRDLAGDHIAGGAEGRHLFFFVALELFDAVHDGELEFAGFMPYVGGGIGFAPLRPVIYSLLSNLSEYASVTVVCGARSPELIPYKAELKEWEDRVSVYVTVDKMTANWTGRVGVVPKIIEEIGISPENAIAVICGPQVMIRFGKESLAGLGFTSDQIYTTLEMKMKCGVGICGRCNIDHRYICRDGPVFRMDTIGNY